MDGWTALPSSFSVEVLDEQEIAAAVNFARDFNLRVNVKGTGKTVFCQPFQRPAQHCLSLRDVGFHTEFCISSGSIVCPILSTCRRQIYLLLPYIYQQIDCRLTRQYSLSTPGLVYHRLCHIDRKVARLCRL